MDLNLFKIITLEKGDFDFIFLSEKFMTELFDWLLFLFIKVGIQYLGRLLVFIVLFWGLPNF